MRKLNEQQVKELKAKLAEGMTQPKVAGLFGVSRSLVSDIATGRIHAGVPWPEGGPPVPKRAGGQRKPIPDYDPTDKRVHQRNAHAYELRQIFRDKP